MCRHPLETGLLAQFQQGGILLGLDLIAQTLELFPAVMYELCQLL